MDLSSELYIIQLKELMLRLVEDLIDAEACMLAEGKGGINRDLLREAMDEIGMKWDATEMKKRFEMEGGSE